MSSAVGSISGSGDNSTTSLAMGVSVSPSSRTSAWRYCKNPVLGSVVPSRTPTASQPRPSGSTATARNVISPPVGTFGTTTEATWYAPLASRRINCPPGSPSGGVVMSQPLPCPSTVRATGACAMGYDRFTGALHPPLTSR